MKRIIYTILKKHVPQNANSVIAYYTQKILKELKILITTNFEKFYPLVKNYVLTKLFKERISNIDDPKVLFNLSEPSVEEFIIKIFVDAFRI